MLSICLFEDDQEVNFRPLTLTKPIFSLRTGCFTQIDRVKMLFPQAKVGVDCRENLKALVKSQNIELFDSGSSTSKVLYLNARWIPNRGVIYNKIKDLNEESEEICIFQGNTLIAALKTADFDPKSSQSIENKDDIDSEFLLSGFADLISEVGTQIEADLPLLEGFSNIEPKSFSSSHFSNEPSILIRGKIEIEANCVLDASKGPILIDDGASIKANSVLYGPLYIGSNATIKAITRLSNAVIGPYSKIGGELSSSIVEGYSNKGHDGYLGNSYISQWCNLGADTNTSNLRNDYGPVKLFNAGSKKDESTGLTFAGLIMADHSKCSINTMFNTGTVVGVSCNLFGPGFHDRHIPSFTWGKPGKYLPYRIDKSLLVAQTMMARRDKSLSDEEKSILEQVYEDRT